MPNGECELNLYCQCWVLLFWLSFTCFYIVIHWIQTQLTLIIGHKIVKNAYIGTSILFRILKFKWDQFRRLKREGSDGFTRGQKEKTRREIILRRATEKRLEKKEIDWFEFLKVVSHTNISITEDLEQQFTENGEQPYDGEDLDIDIIDYGKDICIKCELKIYEKQYIYSCGHTNVCSDCLDDIRSSFEVPTCPMVQCNKPIIDVYPFAG